MSTAGPKLPVLKRRVDIHELNSRELDIKNSNSWGALNYPEQSDR